MLREKNHVVLTTEPNMAKSATSDSHGVKSIENTVFWFKREPKQRTLQTPKRQSIRGKQALKDMSYTVESSRS
jgi:hypothetical protein